MRSIPNLLQFLLLAHIPQKMVSLVSRADEAGFPFSQHCGQQELSLTAYQSGALAMRRERRIAKSTCPVCAHSSSSVLFDLAPSCLRRETWFADEWPAVGQQFCISRSPGQHNFG
jgi:hypothetical protein